MNNFETFVERKISQNYIHYPNTAHEKWWLGNYNKLYIPFGAYLMLVLGRVVAWLSHLSWWKWALSDEADHHG